MSAIALVRCDCGWEIEPIGIAIPVAVTLAPHVVDMIQHWLDGHRLSCQSNLRYTVRDLLKRYRQLQRAQQSQDTPENFAEQLRSKRGFRGETYNPFTDEWS